MNELATRYRMQHQGNDSEAMAAMAFDLMEGDAARFKAGYSEANAVIAVAEVFGVEREDVERALAAARKYEAGVNR